VAKVGEPREGEEGKQVQLRFVVVVVSLAQKLSSCDKFYGRKKVPSPRSSSGKKLFMPEQDGSK
jgi:hypothetical protein